MPASFDRDFALWLTQHGSERSVSVNTLEFTHPKWGSLFVSDFGQDFAAKTEAGTDFLAQPLGFTIDVAADNISTEQRVLIRLDNANGLVGAQLRSLTDEDLQTPVGVVYRVYLDTKPGVPAIDPISLYVTNVNMTRLLVECELAAEFLPNVTAGLRYTFERFPSMLFL